MFLIRKKGRRKSKGSLRFVEKDRMEALGQQKFSMWERKVAVLAGLTKGAEVITGWYNELWDIETGYRTSR